MYAALYPFTNEKTEAKVGPSLLRKAAQGMLQLENVSICSGYPVGPNCWEDKKLDDKSRDYQHSLIFEHSSTLILVSQSKRRGIKLKSLKITSEGFHLFLNTRMHAKVKHQIHIFFCIIHCYHLQRKICQGNC